MSDQEAKADARDVAAWMGEVSDELPFENLVRAVVDGASVLGVQGSRMNVEVQTAAWRALLARLRSGGIPVKRPGIQ